MTELHDLLDRATDRIERPDLATTALARAQRRRRRHQGLVAAAVAAAAVVAVVVSVELTTGEARVDPRPAESPSPSPTVGTATAPEIDPSRIQPVWDPRGVEGLPVTDLGVPRVMESLVPGDVTRPVAVLDDGDRAFLVSADGVTDDLALPEGLGRWRTVSLSPDGTRLVVAGISGVFWRTLDGQWQHLDVDGDRMFGDGAEITWTSSSRSVVLRAHLAGHQIDLDTGEQQRLPMLSNYASWGFAPDGAVVTTGLAVRDWRDGAVRSETSLGPLENLQRPVVDERSLAAARGNTTWPEKRQRDDYDGLIAIDRETLATRGFLRVPDQASYYVDGGLLTPVAWLDDDVLAFTVRPRDAAKTYLVTWNVETGELSRISCWDSDFTAAFATGLLG